MYEGPEFRHLHYFIAVAEECNFGKAATRLHVAQPSLSTQIRLLEEGLKATLFVRGPAGVSLTAAGRTLLPLAKQILAMRARAVHQTAAAHMGSELPFHFGYSPRVNQDVVHEAIIGYKEMVSGGNIEPSSQSSETLYAQVIEGTLDAALINLPVHDKDLFVQSICEERLLICLHADDAFAQQERIP